MKNPKSRFRLSQLPHLHFQSLGSLLPLLDPLHQRPAHRLLIPPLPFQFPCHALESLRAFQSTVTVAFETGDAVGEEGGMSGLELGELGGDLGRLGSRRFGGGGGVGGFVGGAVENFFVVEALAVELGGQEVCIFEADGSEFRAGNEVVVVVMGADIPHLL